MFDDIAGIGMIFDGQVVEFLVGFVIDSFKNTWHALMWPAKAVQIAQPWGAVALGLAFWLFPTYVKPHIEAWLFDENDAREEETQE